MLFYKVNNLFGIFLFREIRYFNLFIGNDTEVVDINLQIDIGSFKYHIFTVFQIRIAQKEYEIFKNDSPTSNPLLNMKGAQILPYYDPVRRKNITKQFGQNQNKILKFSQNPASKHKPKSSPIRKKDLKL